MKPADTVKTYPSQPCSRPRIGVAACVFLWLGVLLIGGMLAGCDATPSAQARSSRSAIEVVLDPQARDGARQSAVGRVPADQAFALFQLVTESRHPITVRRAAVDRMLADNSERFWALSAQRVVQIDDWPMIRLLCARAGEREDRAALPWLVASWSVPSVTVEDPDRPERAAINAIAGIEGFTCLRGLFIDPPDWADTHTRAAAWTTLVRYGSPTPDQLIATAQRLRQSRPAAADPLLDALALCDPVVQVYPSGPEGMLRLYTLVQVTPQAQWDDWTQWYSQQPMDPPATLALRHLPALTHRDRSRDGQSLDVWRGRVAERMRGRRHFYRGEQAGENVVTARPEQLADHFDRLGVGDYLVIERLLDAMDDRALVAELFRQADADRLDTTTEFGGVLTWDAEDHLIAQSFPPALRQHDRVFYASSDCVQAMHTGLAHYHFHAQSHEHPTWAGPGAGDLRFAENLQANCVVLTFIDRNTLNVDVYFPGQVIVDLGCISR